ncbi:UDP-N-acetylmuramoyl-L-alanyl-D-glutamate--2,6-diaminopimelate ligase [Lapidilactobacillus mulanensis]|uniref:UDP-N-acetylmuramoyl-L-alanyl-D-glutamate--2, 6-diaminopimelate ligase n=1 Tax=Lapidilactobacillus mulanensis TaxID=2485999 RepID=A0ABW4DNH3_9LACO|nr:UDP-N-acetylmuramoyl-L-alanyl-D-glutamate--2,6-diaminopimelate ligase [Lapidilactobacillus mulanensis]
MAITLEACILILKEHHILKSSAIQDNLTQRFENAAYNVQEVLPKTLFFCKSDEFRPIYLQDAKDNGAIAYVAEQPYAEGNGMHALIVRNIRKAMALLAQAFYGYPQDELFVIAYTGTKGKTTSTYFTHGILDRVTAGKTAMFSTVDTVLGSKPEDHFKSELTTAESLDLFRNMRLAVDNGNTDLVMEVSSQAYKQFRVFGLTYDVGFFLNISPDHIGPNEHPNFADYLHCKLQLLVNSRKTVINAQTDYFADVYAAATITTDPDSIFLFADDQFEAPEGIEIDFRYHQEEADLSKSRFKLTTHTLKAEQLKISGEYALDLIGDYNLSNATAAIIGAGLAGAVYPDTALGIAHVKIPGRMEKLDIPGHGRVYVDYAHNYTSMMALLSFLKKEYEDPRLIVVVGSPGDKGISRREGFAKAINQLVPRVYITNDDPGFEDPQEIADQIIEGINRDQVEVTVELDRSKAIEAAIRESKPDDVVVLVGKGTDPYQKVRGVDTPWPTDMVVARNVAEKLKDEQIN